jgi:hypothetical protein
MCDDGFDLDFNTQAWKLFYTIIKFNLGAIESLNKQYMPEFVKIISKTSTDSNQTPAVKNSALYFSKVLNLPKNNDNEGKKIILY